MLLETDKQRSMSKIVMRHLKDMFSESPVQVQCMIRLPGAGALGRPRGMDGTGREVGGGYGWGTRVHLWQIRVNVWQNQYNIVM